MIARTSSPKAFMEDLEMASRHMLQFTANASFDDFLTNVMMQYPVFHAIERLGEASKQLMDALPDAEARFPEIAFRRMYATRNRIIHGYATVDLKTVWAIVQKQVPDVHTAAKHALANWPIDLT